MLYMFLSDGDFLKECIKKKSSKNIYTIYTHIYGHTLFDIFGPLVSCVFLINKKNFVAVNKIGTHPLANASISIFR